MSRRIRAFRRYFVLRSDSQVTTVSDNIRCCNERRFGTRQKSNDGGDFLRLAYPMQGTLAAKLFLMTKLINGMFKIWSHDSPWTNCIYANVPRTILYSQDFC